ncbi:MAG: 5,10-methylenetetrahydrofolate reductase [Candidatus Nanopelagicales bacterium]
MGRDGHGTAQELLQRAESGVLLYGITPPRRDTAPERVDEIARATLARLDSVGIDGLIVYDVDAEADRAPDARPFPFTPMLDPADYVDQHLSAWAGPVVVYRAVGKYTEAELGRWLSDADTDRVLGVLVGAASRHQPVTTRLADAYRLHAGLERRPDIGGVCIAERHVGTREEHRRMLSKQADGCTFFVSQVCYDLDHTRDLLSDYLYACQDEGLEPRPVVVTLAPCGSAKTLEFMSWLGIEVPHWLSTELARSHDPLELSYDQCLANARALVRFCRRLGLPFGINVESLTNRKVEIEASVELAREIRRLLD